MERQARLAGVHQQLRDRVDRHVRHAADRPERRALHKHVNDLRAGSACRACSRLDYLTFLLSVKNKCHIIFAGTNLPLLEAV